MVDTRPLERALRAAVSAEVASAELAAQWLSGAASQPADGEGARDDAATGATSPPVPPSAGRALSVVREIKGTGYHLTMHTRSTITLASDASTDAGVQGDASVRHDVGTCTHWATIERLPPSVIFNPYELRRLHRLGRLVGVHDALTMATTELELPAEASRRAGAPTRPYQPERIASQGEPERERCQA